MKHIDYRIERLLHEGFSIGTLERFSSKQIQVLYEKVKKENKKEVKEQPKPVEKTVQQKVIELPSGAKTALGGATVSNEGGKTVITTTATESELEEDEEFDSMDVNKGEDDQDPIQKQGPDGMPTETRLQEKAVSKQQQKIMGLALSVKKGDTPKSEVSKSVQKMSKEMSKKDLEDFASTKHKGLPKKIEATESIKKGVKRNDQKDMIDGVIEILKKVKDINNRKSIAKDMVNKFKRENIQTDFNKFMEDCGVDDTKKQIKDFASTSDDELKEGFGDIFFKKQKREFESMVMDADAKYEETGNCHYVVKGSWGMFVSDEMPSNEEQVVYDTCEEEVGNIEESILRLVQNHLPPHTTKKQLINYISKKR